MRSATAGVGGVQAALLREVYGLVVELRAEIAAFKPTFAAGGGDSAWARMGPAEVSSLEDQEVAAALGVSRFSAGKMVDQAVTLVEVLPRTLEALAAGTLDMARVRFLIDATLNLSAEAVREVEDAALAEAGSGPDRCRRSGAALATDRYTPTVAIADHVRAYSPRARPRPVTARPAAVTSTTSPGPADPPPPRT